VFIFTAVSNPISGAGSPLARVAQQESVDWGGNSEKVPAHLGRHGGTGDTRRAKTPPEIFDYP